MNYIIREIEPRDNAAVEAVIRACLVEFGGDRPGTAWMDPDLGRFSEVYRSEGRKYWVAENESGRVVGGAGVGELPGVPGVCELQKMYCLPEARGTGAARRLMAEALAFARERYEKCYLETFGNMKAAHRFYEKHGFHCIAEPLGRTGHFGCDVMYLKELKGGAGRRIEPCSEDDIKAVADGINAYNASQVPFTQPRPWVDMSRKVVDENGKIIAGCSAVMYGWRVLYVELLWVDEPWRRQGVGLELLRAVEDEARRQGAYLAHLDTFDFQARGFYEKQGYALFGTLEDVPPGHRRYYLQKRL